MIGKMFRLPKHQQFEYIPRYYDPVKEELEERANLRKRKGISQADITKERISRGFRRGQAQHVGIYTKGAFRATVLRLLIMAVLLTIAAFFLQDILVALL